MRASVVLRFVRLTAAGRLPAAVVAGLVLCFAVPPPAVAEEAKVSGSLVVNGEEVSLPYVYVWAEKEGFYDSDDPTWTILFVGRPVAQRDLDHPVWDSAWVQIGVTETSTFGDEPEVQVYSQSLKFSADSGGNVSGGTYPAIELEGLGTDRVSGRVYHAQPQEFFDDTYGYDFTFSAPLSDPDAPIGDPLPAGGGEPGAAYLKWVETVHSGDLEKLKSLMPAEMADQLAAVSPEEAREELEFIQMMTPTEVRILGGSSDGETAVLEAEGSMDGEKLTFEVKMVRMGDAWVATGVSM